MAILHFTCTVCGKRSHETRKIELTQSVWVFLSCGHKLVTTRTKYVSASEDTYENLTAQDGSRLYPFQVKTCQFMEKADFRVHIGHDMRLGKTMCAIAPVKFHKERLLPAAIVCKANLIRQMERAVHNWLGPETFVQCLTKGSDIPLPKVVDFYIVSFDLVEKHLERLAKCAIQYLIIDESQFIKNTDTARYENVKLLQTKIPHLATLSGTPIENNAVEYFPILNLLQPRRFWEQETYIREYCSYYLNSYGQRKLGGLRRSAERSFRQMTEDFIIRFRRDEVDMEFPTITRRHSFLDIPDALRKEYEKVFGELEDYIEQNSVDTQNLGKHTSNLLAFIAKLRHITGKAKVDYISEWITEFHEAFPEERLTIFTHHREVAASLHKAIPNAIRISDDDNLDSRDKKLALFIKTPGAILLARTLAEGVGLNFDGCCTNGVILEREFNPSKESQAESRFADIKASGKKVNILYPIVADSIDEWMTELVEKKREGIDATLNGWDKTLAATDTDVLQGLFAMIQRKGKRFKL